jgi:VWFA-related protein
MAVFRIALIAVGAILSAQPVEEPVLRVTVRLVQIDAVVTGKHGHHVPNLTRDDFKLFQDGKEQVITHFSYVEAAGGQAKPAARPSPSEERRLSPRQRSMAPPAPLVREATRRTLALVVDDLGMSWQNMPRVKEALRKFVDEQMGPGDAAAILRTGSSAGVLGRITNDKRLLHAAIERVRWSALSRAGMDTIAPFNEDENTQDSGNDDKSKRVKVQTTRDFERARAASYTLGTLGALAYLIEEMRDMPGRKSVVLFSDGITLFNAPTDDKLGNPIASRLRNLTDLASRAGVVFYTIDTRGLQPLGLRASDNVRGLISVRRKLEQRNRDYREKQDGLAFLARETGGLFATDTNDLTGATRQAMEDQSGYYLLGYSPDEGTFAALGGRAKYYRLKLRMTRPYLRVRTRAGFVGIADKPRRQLPDTPQRQLLTALTSPFHSGGIGLRLTPLFRNMAGKGSYIHTWLHIDGRHLTFQQDGEGWRKAVLDVAIATFGKGSVATAPSAQTFEIRLPTGQFDTAMKQGLLFELMHAVAKPGAYQLRAAVRDAASRKVGSAGQFLDIPDVSGERLGLSGIEMRTVEKGGAEPDDPALGPAVRRFAPGDPITYSFVVYNPKVSPSASTEIQAHVFRDGQIVWTGEPHSLEASAVGERREFTVARELRFGAGTSEGVYMLRVSARNRSGRKTTAAAVQWMDFELRMAARQ